MNTIEFYKKNGIKMRAFLVVCFFISPFLWSLPDIGLHPFVDYVSQLLFTWAVMFFLIMGGYIFFRIFTLIGKFIIGDLNKNKRNI